MPIAYGYARASTGKQTLTFDVQKSAIEKYYEDKLKPLGYEWGGVREDKATSGTKPFTERTEGLKLWNELKRGDALIWLKMDRAFRSVSDGSSMLQQFRSKGVETHSMDIGLDTSTPMGEFVMHLMIILAQLERSWISARTKEAFAIKKEKKQGLNQYSCAAGWKRSTDKQKKSEDDDWFTPDLAERKLIDETYEKWLIVQNNERLASDLYWKKVNRDGGTGYTPQFLLYSYFAKAKGYPKDYNFTVWKEWQQQMIADGHWDASHDGLIGLMHEAGQENAESS